MTDADLARAAKQAADLEGAMRAHWQATDTTDLAERDAALVAGRQATALRRMVERWITARAQRAALHQ